MKKIIILCIAVLCVSSTKSPSMTGSNVYREIVNVGIIYPDIAYAQALLESGSFTSLLARKNHNIFGMRVPTKRPTTATGKRNGYATYSSWQESIQDYKIWQTHLFKRHPMNREQFKAYIDKYYSTSSNYLVKIDKIIKTIKKTENEKDSSYPSSYDSSIVQR